MLKHLPISSNWEVHQGADFAYAYLWKNDGAPMALSNWSANLQARPSVHSSTVFFELDETDGITLTNDGLILVEIPHATSAAWVWSFAVADLVLTTNDDVTIRFARIHIRNDYAVLR
jgi:hypothetical protein